MKNEDLKDQSNEPKKFDLNDEPCVEGGEHDIESGYYKSGWGHTYFIIWCKKCGKRFE